MHALMFDKHILFEFLLSHLRVTDLKTIQFYFQTVNLTKSADLTCLLLVIQRSILSLTIQEGRLNEELRTQVKPCHPPTPQHSPSHPSPLMSDSQQTSRVLCW